MNPKNACRCALLVCAVLGAETSIAEGPAKNPPTRVVSFADLDLGEPADVATLYRRIQTAAKNVCQFPEGVRPLATSAAWRKCTVQATERAVRDVDVAALTATHLARTGRHTLPSQVAHAE